MDVFRPLHEGVDMDDFCVESGKPVRMSGFKLAVDPVSRENEASRFFSSTMRHSYVIRPGQSLHQNR